MRGLPHERSCAEATQHDTPAPPRASAPGLETKTVAPASATAIETIRKRSRVYLTYAALARAAAASVAVRVVHIAI